MTLICSLLRDRSFFAKKGDKTGSNFDAFNIKVFHSAMVETSRTFQVLKVFVGYQAIFS